MSHSIGRRPLLAALPVAAVLTAAPPMPRATL